MNISSAMDWWWDTFKTHARKKTVLGYSADIENHIKPGIGDIFLDEITSRQIRIWIDHINLSNKTRNNILIPLRNMFSDAITEGFIKTNPMLHIKSFKINKNEPTPFTPKQVDLIINHLQGAIKQFYIFSFWTGLSTGEQIALMWRDIDFKSNAFYVRRSLSSGKFLEETKNATRWRKVELLYPALQALCVLKPSDYELNPEQYSNEYIFKNPRTHDHWRIDALTTEWKKTLKVNNLPYQRPYNTRHTYASIMLSAGLPPNWIRQQLGHTSMKMLETVYARWIDEDESSLKWLSDKTRDKENGPRFSEFFLKLYK